MKTTETTDEATMQEIPSDGSKGMGIFIGALMLGVWLIVLGAHM